MQAAGLDELTLLLAVGALLALGAAAALSRALESLHRRWHLRSILCRHEWFASMPEPALFVEVCPRCGVSRVPGQEDDEEDSRG